MPVTYRKHRRNNRGSIKKTRNSSNPFGNTTIETGSRIVDRMMEEKNKRWEEVITSTDLAHKSS